MTSVFLLKPVFEAKNRDNLLYEVPLAVSLVSSNPSPDVPDRVMELFAEATRKVVAVRTYGGMAATPANANEYELIDGIRKEVVEGISALGVTVDSIAVLKKLEVIPGGIHRIDNITNPYGAGEEFQELRKQVQRPNNNRVIKFIDVPLVI